MSYHYHLRYRNGVWRALSVAEYNKEIIDAIARVMSGPQFLMSGSWKDCEQ